MPNNGHRYLLVMYTYVIGRWWRATLVLGLVLLVLAIGLAILPGYLPQAHFLQVERQSLWGAGGIGVVAIGLSIFLIAIRRSAYVQAQSDHIRLVTPFLRLNISYRRILHTSTAEMSDLYSLKKGGGWRRSFLRPLAKKTVIVLDLNGYPLPRAALRLFLSPYFFPDKSPRMVLMVPDWIEFSAELESFRSTWMGTSRQAGYSGAATLTNPLDPKK